MMTALNIAMCVIVAAMLVPTAVFVVECLLSLLPARSPVVAAEPRPSVAVLIPAHNEEAVIAMTLKAIKSQLSEQDRIVVVADNCTDRTAALAREAGAVVVARVAADKRGKGYALDHGIRSLADSPPEVLLVIDADCQVLEGTVERLATLASRLHRPVQGSDLLDPPPSPDPRDVLSSLAFRVKNLVRPLGLLRLGLPCQLMGTGMAFPWDIIRAVPLAGGSIVEDMQLGVDLAIAGTPALFCPEVGVRGQLGAGDAAMKQRRRWEHGHLQTLLRQCPRLWWQALRQRRLDLLVLGLDLAVPPLSLLAMLWGVAFLASCVAALRGASRLPFVLASLGIVAFASAVLAGWAGHCRQAVPFRLLLAAPFYVIRKLSIYLGFVSNREKQWVRTDRVGGAGGAGETHA